MDLGKDVRAARFPLVRLRTLVVLGQIGRDHVGQFLHAREAARPDAVPGQIREEPLDQVHPRTRGRREVHVEPLVPLQPNLHLRVLVRAIVVRDDVHREILRDLAVDLLEEPQPLQMGVLALGAVDQLALQVAEGGEQADRTVPVVVVGLRADVPGAERQAWLGAFQRLALRLLVAAQHDRLLGGIQVQPDHVPELAFKILVVRQLERLRAVRLETAAAPDAADAGL